MSGTASYDPKRETGGFEAELQRLREQLALSWPQEARLLQWLGLRDGMAVLELGSGPGYVTEALLRLLPASPITAIDNDPQMVAQAREILGAAHPDRLHLVEASVTASGLPAGIFDFAIARYVFQHLRDPIAAARETLRVLKPGGRLAVIDIDAALWGIVQPMEPRLAPIHAKAARLQTSGGGNRLIGRQLWRILQRAGYTQLQLEAFVYHSDELGLTAFHPQMNPSRLRPAVDAGYITEQEYGMVQAGYERFLRSPDSYILMVGLMICGTKPSEGASV